VFPHIPSVSRLAPDFRPAPAEAWSERAPCRNEAFRRGDARRARREPEAAALFPTTSSTSPPGLVRAGAARGGGRRTSSTSPALARLLACAPPAILREACRGSPANDVVASTRPLAPRLPCSRGALLGARVTRGPERSSIAVAGRVGLRSADRGLSAEFDRTGRGSGGARARAGSSRAPSAAPRGAGRPDAPSKTSCAGLPGLCALLDAPGAAREGSRWRPSSRTFARTSRSTASTPAVERTARCPPEKKRLRADGWQPLDPPKPRHRGRLPALRRRLQAFDVLLVNTGLRRA